MRTRLLQLLPALAVAAAADIAAAQQTDVGIYTDATGTVCSLADQSPGIVSAYVVVRHDPQTGVRSIRFAAPRPDCFSATYIADAAVGGANVTGNSQEGVAVGFPFCSPTPLHVLTILYYGYGTTPACCPYPVLPDPAAGSEIVVTDCDEVAFPAVAITSTINADATCACTNNSPPVPPMSPNPPDQRTGEAWYVTLHWLSFDPDNDPLEYDLYFGTDSHPPLVETGITQPEYLVGTLDFSTQYFWRVVVRDNHGAEATGPLWTFTVTDNHAPNPPANPSPAHNTREVLRTAGLAWSCTDPEDHPVLFRVYFGTESPPPLVASGVTRREYNPGALAYGTRYYWRVEAIDPLGLETSGPEWTFVTLFDAASDGDVNGDGAVTPGDALCAERIANAGGVAPPGCDPPGWKRHADVVCDGVINLQDAHCIFNRWLWNLCPFCDSPLGPAEFPPGVPANAVAPTARSGRPPATPAPTPRLVLSSVERPYGSTGTVTLSVRLEDYTGPIEAVGFDLYYDRNALRFANWSRGAVTQSWQAFACANRGTWLRIGGYSGYFSGGGGGVIATVTFSVTCGDFDSTRTIALCPTNLTDDIADATPVCGGVSCVQLNNGDTNGDGLITAGDASCAMEAFLSAPAAPPAGCGRPGYAIRADVNCSAAVTPGDALCIERHVRDSTCAFCVGLAPSALPLDDTAAITFADIDLTLDTLTVVLDLDGVPRLEAMGMDVTFPAEFTVVDANRESALNGFDVFAASEPEPGRARIGAFDVFASSEVRPASLLRIRFATHGARAGFVTCERFVDDLAGVAPLSFTLDTVVQTRPGRPAFALHQNRPNPFNPATSIGYETPAPAHVRIAIYDLEGRLVRTIVDRVTERGAHVTEWNGTDERGRVVSSGVYFCVLEASGERLTRKLVLLK